MRVLPVLVAATVLPLGSCDVAATAAPPALTTAAAQRVLAHFQATNNAANRSLDGRLLATVETGAQLDMDLAAYKLRRSMGRRLSPFTYTRPVFYIPRLLGHPRWFVVDATSGGRRSPTHHALLFTQDRPSGPWRLAADPYPSRQGVLAGVTVDREGYATAVPAEDERLALAPDQVAGAHSALLNKGPTAPDAALLAPGTYTTGAFTTVRHAVRRFRQRQVAYATRFAPSGPRIFALRMIDGGAIVWYLVRQREVYVARRPGALRVGGDLTGLVQQRAVRGRIDAVALVQYLAVVPPRGKGTVQVTGGYRKAVRAKAS